MVSGGGGSGPKLRRSTSAPVTSMDRHTSTEKLDEDVTDALASQAKKKDTEKP